MPVTGCVTVTTQYAVSPVSTFVHIIDVVPAPVAVTFPSLSTVQTSLSRLSHDTILLSAFSGRHVALSQNTCPFLTVISVVLRTIDVTGCLTYILHMAVTPPSKDLQRIVALPVPTASTSPLESTIQTFVLDDSQLTVLLVAVRGRTSAVILNLSPFDIISSV